MESGCLWEPGHWWGAGGTRRAVLLVSELQVQRGCFGPEWHALPYSSNAIWPQPNHKAVEVSELS